MLARKLRPFALALGAFVLITLVLVTTFRVYGSADLSTAAAAFEAEVHSLDLTTFKGPELAPAENAAHWIQAAAAALAVEEDDRAFLRDNFRDPDAEFDLERSRSLLADNEPALELFYRAITLEQSNYDLQYEDGLELEIPNLLNHLHASFLLLLDLRVALHDERWDDALRAQAAQRRVASALYEETPLIFQLVGLVMEKAAWKGVQWMLEAGLEDPETLKALRQPISRQSPEQRFRRSMAGEAACFYQMRGRLNEIPDWAVDLSWWQKQQLRYRSKPVLAEFLNGFRYLAQNYRGHTAVELADDSRFNGSEAFGFLGELVGNLADAAYKFKHTEAIALMADQALALRLAALEDGTYPATWKTLHSPYSGAAYLYEHQADGGVRLSAPQMVPTLERLRPGVPHNPLGVWELPAPAVP